MSAVGKQSQMKLTFVVINFNARKLMGKAVLLVLNSPVKLCHIYDVFCARDTLKVRGR